MVGGFLGDFVKGVLVGKRPRAIEDGIRLHRSIDAFTNTEPIMSTSRRYFDPELRRFVPILIDIIGDHFLAANFEAHLDQELPSFAQRSYTLLERHREWMPVPAERYRLRMTQRDGLVRNRDCESLRTAFDYLSRRFGRENLASGAMAGLTNHYEELQSDFESYFPRLVEHVQSWRSVVEQEQ